MADTFLYIYIYLTVPTYGNTSCKHAMLVNGASVEISQQIMMTRCLLWRDANCGVRLERTLLLLWSHWQQKHSWTYQKAKFINNHFSPLFSVPSCYKSHRLSTSLRPLNSVVLHTTIMRRFKVCPYFTSNFYQLSSVTSSISDDPLLNSQ